MEQNACAGSAPVLVSLHGGCGDTKYVFVDSARSSTRVNVGVSTFSFCAEERGGLGSTVFKEAIKLAKLDCGM